MHVKMHLNEFKNAFPILREHNLKKLFHTINSSFFNFCFLPSQFLMFCHNIFTVPPPKNYGFNTKKIKYLFWNHNFFVELLNIFDGGIVFNVPAGVRTCIYGGITLINCVKTVDPILFINWVVSVFSNWPALLN